MDAIDPTTDPVTAEGASLEAGIAEQLATEAKQPEPELYGEDMAARPPATVEGLTALIEQLYAALAEYRNNIQNDLSELRDEINKLKLGPTFVSTETSIGDDLGTRVARIENQIRHMV